jgi:hypothetical protein
VDADATGEAEVEFGSVLRFLIDGTEVATVTVDARGRAEVELDVPMHRTAAPR